MASGLDFIWNSRVEVDDLMRELEKRFPVKPQPVVLASDQNLVAKKIEELLPQNNNNDNDETQPWPAALECNDLPELAETADAVLEGLKEEQQVKVFCCSWNLMGKSATEEALESLVPKDRFHIYAVGSQECEKSIAQSAMNPSKKSWEVKLWQHLGCERYCMLRSHTLQATHLAVFVRKELLGLISNVGSAAVATGYKDTLGNKGGVGISFSLGRTSFLFIASHLEAHQNHVFQRNQHFHRIDTQMALPPGFKGRQLLSRTSSWKKVEDDDDASKSKETAKLDRGYDVLASEDPRSRVTSRFNQVFWMGDFNYRINGTRDFVEDQIQTFTKQSHQELLKRDQLNIERDQGIVFKGFEEGPLNFKPTYKYDKNSNTYDSSKKQRIPSWTDRILHKSTTSLQLVHYASVQSIKISDHRPVVAMYNARVTGSNDPTIVGLNDEDIGTAASQVCLIS